VQGSERREHDLVHGLFVIGSMCVRPGKTARPSISRAASLYCCHLHHATPRTGPP
jgi:hypothetical protein